MCDRLVRRRGDDGREYDAYLCHDCLGELDSLRVAWPPHLDRDGVLDRITAFVDSDKAEAAEDDPPPTTERWFRELTDVRYEGRTG
jgi:hypothetical protein